MAWQRTLDLTVLVDALSGSPLVVSKTDKSPVQSYTFFARDTVPVRIRFVQKTGNATSPLQVVQLPAGSEIVLMGNAKADIDADPPLYACESFTEVEVTPGEDWYYEGLLNLNTVSGNAAVDALAAGQVLDAVWDIEIRNGDNSERTTFQFSGPVKPDVVRDQEAPDGELQPYPAATLLLLVSQDTANIKRGVTTIGSGVEEVAVTFATPFAAVPTNILLALETPSADPLILCQLQGGFNAAGFTARLGAATPSANYKLHWLALK